MKRRVTPDAVPVRGENLRQNSGSDDGSLSRNATTVVASLLAAPHEGDHGLRWLSSGWQVAATGSIQNRERS